MKQFILEIASILALGSYSFASEYASSDQSKVFQLYEAKPGKFISSSSDRQKQEIEHFGLSAIIDSDWVQGAVKEIFKSNQLGYAGYIGYLSGAKKKAYVNIEMSPKKIEETFKKNNTPDTYSKTEIGSGTINGHPVDVYYFENQYKNKKNGSVYLSFKDEMYFSDPANPDSDFFPMYAYISLSGELLSDLNSEDIQTVLDSYVTPLFNSIKVTDLNTFATDTTNESTPFKLNYHRKSDISTKAMSEEKLEKVLLSNIEKEEEIIDPFAKFKLVPIGKKNFIWKNFLINASDEWYKNSVKSNEKKLTLQTDNTSNLEMVILNTKVIKSSKKYKNTILKELYKSFKNDPKNSQVFLYEKSKYTVLGNKKCSVIMAIGDNGTKISTFLPYRNGKLYIVITISSEVKEKRVSSKVKELLKNISLKR